MGKEEEVKPDIDSFLKEQETSIALDEKEHENLVADLSDFEARIDEEFLPYFEKTLSDDEREVMELSEDPKEQAALVLAKRTAFVDEQIEPRKQKLQEFAQALEAKRTDYNNNLQIKAFRDAHPDVDIDAFGEFIQSDLTPRQREELESEAAGNMLKYFESALLLYNKVNKKEKKPTEVENGGVTNMDEVPSAGSEGLTNTDASDADYKYKALGIGYPVTQ
jgi:hypothetical protein